VRDASLRHCLQFGVGLHHAGLAENDRQIVERLFVSQKIQVRVGGLWVAKFATGMPCCCI
jgi:replicative superfamily II helicase